MKDGSMCSLLFVILTLGCVIAVRAEEPKENPGKTNAVATTLVGHCKADLEGGCANALPEITAEMSLAYYAALAEFQPAQAQAEAAKVKLDAAVGVMKTTCGAREIVPTPEPTKFKCGPTPKTDAKKTN